MKPKIFAFALSTSGNPNSKIQNLNREAVPTDVLARADRVIR
jgi:hypothetical protein